MASGNKLNEALQVILDNLNETNCADEEIEAIEAENFQLRKRKADLMTKLNRHTTAYGSIILVKDMLSRQGNLNETRLQAKEQAMVRYKERAREAAAQTADWQEKLQQVDSLMTLSHNDVVELISELEKKITVNHLKINELLGEYANFSQNQQETEDVSNLIETLKSVEQDQSELLRMLKEKSQISQEEQTKYS